MSFPGRKTVLIVASVLALIAVTAYADWRTRIKDQGLRVPVVSADAPAPQVTFKDLDGKVVVNADPTKSTLELNIKTASIDTKNAKRDGHLQSPDFFNASQFPAITFKSTKVAKSGDGYDVTGDLTIRGKTKSITAKVVPTGSAEDPQKKLRAGFEGKAMVNRNDFDVSFMPGALGDNIEVTVALEGIAQ